MRRNVTMASVTVLMLGLAGCMPVPQPSGPDSIDPQLILDLPPAQLVALRSELRGLTGGAALVDARHGDCAATGFDVPGQEYRILGAGGPFALAGGPNGVVDGGLVATPGQVAAQMRFLDGFRIPQGNVTIVVLDDFGSTATNGYRIDPKAVEGALRTALSALPAGADEDARQVALADTAAALQANGQLSHGSLVLEHVLALLRSLGGTLQAAESGGFLVEFPQTGAQLTVRAVDLGGTFQTVDAVRDRMVEAVAEARRQQEPVVVNMSFAVVPCDIGLDFANNRDRYPTFGSYTAALAGLPANVEALERHLDLQLSAVAAAVLMEAVVTQPVAADPLALYLADAGRSDDVRYVAASGNYGLEFALYPAAWPEVLGSSSRDVAKNPLDPASVSVFSDRGELLVGGAYFALAGLIDPITAPTLPALVYAGTSFSAPAVSVLVAADLLENPARCGLDAAGLPVLRGADDDTPLEHAYPSRCLP